METNCGGGKENDPNLANTPKVARSSKRRFMDETPDDITPRAEYRMSPRIKRYMETKVPREARPRLSTEITVKLATRELAKSFNKTKKYFKDRNEKLPHNLKHQLAILGNKSTGFTFQSRQIGDQADRLLQGKSPQPGRGKQYKLNMEIEQKIREQVEQQQADRWMDSISQAHTESVSPLVKVRAPPPCEGIRPQKLLELKYYLSNQARDIADSIDECNLGAFSQKVAEYPVDNEKMLTDMDSFYSFYKHCGIIPSVRWTAALEDCGGITRITFRAKECTRQVAANRVSVSQCSACANLKSAVHTHVQRTIPLGSDGKPIPSTTTHQNIARHPETTKLFLKQISEEHRKTKRQLESALSRLGILTEMIELGEQKNPAIHAATSKVFDAANEAVRTSDLGKDKDVVHLWELMYENLRVVNERNGQMRGIRFHPEVLNFALALLARTSHRIYDEVSNVFRLPSLSYVLRKQKQRTGSQNESDTIHGLMVENIQAIDAFFIENDIPVEKRWASICFDSVKTKQGIQWDASGNMSGCDSEFSLSLMTNQFVKRAKLLSQKDEKDDELLKGIDKLESNVPNLAEDFLLYKASVQIEGHKLSLIVARQSCSSIDDLRLRKIEMAIREAFMIHSIGIMSFTGDGAVENVSYFEKQCTVTMGSLLSTTTKAVFQELDIEEYLEFEVALSCSYTKQLIFFLEDMPHLMKRLVNTMERSSIAKESRFLIFGKLGNALQLDELKRAWRVSEGASNQIAMTKLTEKHFSKDNFERMRVAPAMQILSASVVNLLKAIRADSEMLKRLDRDSEFYRPLEEMAGLFNRLVDLVNGRDPKAEGEANWTPENARSVQKELLAVLSWLHKWKKDNERLKLGKQAFLADETWNGWLRMILGYVAMIEVFVIGKGLTICPRKTLSDPCEHVFSQLRNLAGSTDKLTSQIALAGCAKNSVSAQLRVSPGCSYQGLDVEKREYFKKNQY